MQAAKKVTVDSKLLQELVPLNALSDERFRELSGKIIVEEVFAGRYLFRKGDRDANSIYVLEGKVNLIDGFRKVISDVEAGTDISRYPIANQQPRPLSARAVKKVVIARVDSSLLDVYLTWDQTNTAEAVEIKSDSNEDWMTRLLQSEAFIKIPPSMIQSLLIKMEQVPVNAGDAIIEQGEGGDYFYTVHQGRCAVTRVEEPGSEPRLLAELDAGDSFGEEALVSDAPRNATVTMLTDGDLMRLAKQDFVELLKNQLVKRVDYDQAVSMVDEGAVWVDVRTEDEYSNGAFEDSVNIPLSCLRGELSELVFNAKYIICCDTGRRSESAGFLLSHKGFDVYVLEGGIPGYSSSADVHVAGDAAETSAGVKAEVVQLAPGEESASDLAQGTQVVAVADSGEELTAVRARCDTLLAENGGLQDTEARLNAQLEQVQADLGEATGKLNSLHEQVRLDAEQLQLLRSELGESGEKLGEFYARESDAAGEMRALKARCKSLQDELEDRSSTYEESVAELQSELCAMQDSIEASRTQTEEQASVARQAGDLAAEQLQTRLQQSEQQTTALQQGLEQASSELDKARSELQAKTGELSEVESGNVALTEQLKTLQAELEAGARSLDDARRMAADQENSSAVVEQMQREKEQLQADMQQAAARIEEQQAELDGLGAARHEHEEQLQQQLLEAQ